VSSFHHAQTGGVAKSVPNRLTSGQERCLLCESPEIATTYGGLLKCSGCGHIFTSSVDSQQLHDLYTEDYFRGEEYYDYLSDQSAIELNFHARLKVLRSFLDPARHCRLLEIGCAFGFFLKVVQPLFDSVEGIDISEPAVRYAAERLNLKVTSGDLLEMDISGREFDVVCIWDTIEHLGRPDLYLEKLERHMRSGALLAITTGDIGSLNARLRRERWRLMHPPSHAHYFSRRSLGRFLDKLGFTVLYDRHCGYYRSFGSMAYAVFVQGHKRSGPLNLIRRLGIESWPIYMNLHDIMYTVARKR
jgi:2-polyprenyl-3-methyl-5-hydroxy-6-metoxy-1,4-benzoquinol methylase